MQAQDCNYFFVDIDGTLTNYGKSAMDNRLHGNFLFPIIRDLMIETGWEKAGSENAIDAHTRSNVFWDYTDILAEFKLPVSEAFSRFRKWHKENIIPCEDGIPLRSSQGICLIHYFNCVKSAKESDIPMETLDPCPSKNTVLALPLWRK